MISGRPAEGLPDQGGAVGMDVVDVGPHGGVFRVGPERGAGQQNKDGKDCEEGEASGIHGEAARNLPRVGRGRKWDCRFLCYRTLFQAAMNMPLALRS